MTGNARIAVWSLSFLTMTTVICLSGCAAKTLPLSVADIQSANAAPLEQNGLVYFYRPPKFMGFSTWASFPIWDEAEPDKPIVVMNNEGYYLHFCLPGKHTFATRSEAKDSLSIDVEQGRVYFVKYFLGWGAVIARPHMELVSEEQGTKEAADCKKRLEKD